MTTTALYQLISLLATIWISSHGPIFHVRVRQLGGERHLRRVEANARVAEDMSGTPATVIAVVMHAESGFDPYAVSSRGARGPMQLLPGTPHYREWRAACRLDPDSCIQANIVIGARLLQRNWELCGGDWSHALARYRGLGCVPRDRERRMAAVARKWGST